MSLFHRVVVPVASEEDARATARALAPHLEPDDEVVAVHVVPDAPGGPDPAPSSELLADAEGFFDAFAAELGRDDVTREALHEADVGAAILDAAAAADATAIAFTPRGGSRWVKLLAGDVTSTLLEGSPVPVVVLPDDEGAGSP